VSESRFERAFFVLLYCTFLSLIILNVELILEERIYYDDKGRKRGEKWKSWILQNFGGR
jgi:hypothetical protein